MDVLWFIYNMGMFALLTIGAAMLVTSAIRASKSGLPIKDVAIALFGIALFGGSLIYWLNGTPQLSVEVPRWYFAFNALDSRPCIGKKLTG